MTLETTNRRCGDRCLSGQTRGATRRCSCARRWTSARSSCNVDLDLAIELAFQPSRQNVAIHYFRAVISSCSSSSNVALVHNSAFIFCASFLIVSLFPIIAWCTAVFRFRILSLQCKLILLENVISVVPIAQDFFELLQNTIMSMHGSVTQSEQSSRFELDFS